MASGRAIGDSQEDLPFDLSHVNIPARATRHLQSTTQELTNENGDVETEELNDYRSSVSARHTTAFTSVTTHYSSSTRSLPPTTGLAKTSQLSKQTISLQVAPARPQRTRRLIEEEPVPFFARHKSLLSISLCFVAVIVVLGVLLATAISLRPSGAQILNLNNGKVYDIQVGGNLANTWQNDKPLPAKTPIVTQSGPYSVLGKPTLQPDFMNAVLAAKNSPAAGKGQALYDLGIQYEIDPAFALAFFMHESTFGTKGEATSTKSLGNLRCIPNADCVDQDRGGYASFPTWEAGFKAWFELIRNLYVARWGLTTIDQIIPKYAPQADNNNEQGYINSLKHALDTWRSGEIIV